MKAKVFKQKLVDFGIKQEIEIVDHPDKIVQSVDIIFCSTRSNEPVFNGQLLKDGTHINSVGSYLPHMREIDSPTIKRAPKIVADDLDGAMEEAGELIYANKETDWSFSDIYSELADIVEADKIRKSDNEITFLKSVGAAYFDLFVAIGIYKKALNFQFGQHFQL